jgi:hypothetical protein
MGNTNRELITDEEIASNPDMYRDEDGVHLKVGRGDILIEPSESWLDRQKAIESNLTPPEPTQEDYMMDLDYRVSLIELGL